MRGMQPILLKEIVNDDAVLKAVNISNKPTPTLTPAFFPLGAAATAIDRTTESAGNALAALGNAATAIGGATQSAGNVLGALDNDTATSRTTSESAGNMLASAKTLVESESQQQTQFGFRSQFFDTKMTKTT